MSGVSAGHSPRYPLEGVVSWNMNTTCNYRCSYCTQRFLDDRKRWAADVPRFVAAFAALPGDWEVKLSGGEPFEHPAFHDVVRGMVDAGIRVSVVTNFSAKPDALGRFAETTAERPGVFSASLHTEFTTVDAFLGKAVDFASTYAGRFVVTCVATKDALPKLPRLQDQFAAAGIRFRVQPEKQDRDVIDYSPAERDVLVQLGGHNGTGRVDPDFSGRLCWAGARYLIVDDRGEAFRCYPARRRRRERLGNLLEGSFRLGTAATPCEYSYCNCTVPQQRGMVDTSERRGVA